MGRSGRTPLLCLGLLALGLAACEPEVRDHPKDNFKPEGDREHVDYNRVDFADLSERVVFFAELDQKLRLWREAKNKNVHEVIQPTELALKEMVRGNFSQLVTACREGQPGERAIASMALGFSNDSRALTPLLDLLADPDPNLRYNALVAIGNIHDPETPVDPILPAIEDTDPMVRAGAAYCLGGIVPPMTDKGALIPLLKATQDPDTRVRANAVATLGYMGNHMATKTIVSNSLFDEHWIVRYNACAALGRMKDQRAVVPLIEKLDDENQDVRIMAEEALRQITDQDYGRNKSAWRAWADENKTELE